jgi:hypothetical protein
MARAPEPFRPFETLTPLTSIPSTPSFFLCQKHSSVSLSLVSPLFWEAVTQRNFPESLLSQACELL